MKASIALFSLFFCLAVVTVNAQKISGVVRDQTGQAAEYATVLLYNTVDSTLVKSIITDDNGRYDIENVSNGKYFLNSCLVGNGDGTSGTFEYSGDDKYLPPIIFGNRNVKGSRQRKTGTEDENSSIKSGN